MNNYKKYCPNVWIAECTEKHKAGETIIIETKYGKENYHIVHNLVGYRGTKETPTFLYSITRADGFNSQERAKNRADRRKAWAGSAEAKSDDYYNKSNKDNGFLSLGEPIKVGHHSERRHRKMFDDAWANMGKSVAFQDKALEHEAKANYWERMAKKIDLSLPESLDFFPEQLADAKEYHQFLKDNPDKRPHSMALQYASKKVKDTARKVEQARKLWGEQEPVEIIVKSNKTKTNPLDNFEGLFFAFNTEQFKEGMHGVGLTAEETDKILSIGHGGYLLKTRKEAFKIAMKG